MAATSQVTFRIYHTMHGVGKLPRQQNADTQSNISYSLSLNLGKIKTSIQNLYHPDKRDQDVRMEMLKQCYFPFYI